VPACFFYIKLIQYMSWFKRSDKGILTPTEAKREVPDGLWFKSPAGKIVHTRELKNNAYVVPEEDFHVRIGSAEYFEVLFDNNQFTELDKDMEAGDPLNFTDTKAYPKRVKESQQKTDLKDAVRTAYGKMSGIDIVIACMDFSFIGGSMGSVVGEKVARAMDHSLQHKKPMLVISRSGGARMMEGGISLMQMAKTSAKIALLDQAKIPFVSLLTDPTTGGVTASFAMLGDFNIAEPGSMIGFAGPRVIRETIGKDLPKGFQSAEFVLEHGFLDFIIDRRNLKSRLTTLFRMLQ
jgi:acetyl-CoA carboxylase carboxyl transferase subunit beta